MNTPWHERVVLERPVREVALRWPCTFEEFEQRLRAREEAGYERGYREAERFLSEQLVQQRAEVLELQNGVLQSLRATLPRVIADCERGLIELAVGVAEKLVSGLPVSADMVAAAIREALARAEQASTFRVLLHPEDLKLLQRLNEPAALDPAPSEARIQWEASAEVGRGGCLVHTDFGIIDARRAAKAELLRDALKDL